MAVTNRGNMIELTEAGDFLVLPCGIVRASVKVVNGEAVLMYGGSHDTQTRPYLQCSADGESVEFPNVYGYPNYVIVSSISADETCFIQILVEEFSDHENPTWGDDAGAIIVGRSDD